MLDIKLLRNDPERVKENIRKKFQDQKLPLVDEVVALDKEYRESASKRTACATSARPFPSRSAACWPRARRTRPRPPRPR